METNYQNKGRPKKYPTQTSVPSKNQNMNNKRILTALSEYRKLKHHQKQLEKPDDEVTRIVNSLVKDEGETKGDDQPYQPIKRQLLNVIRTKTNIKERRNHLKHNITTMDSIKMESDLGFVTNEINKIRLFNKLEMERLIVEQESLEVNVDDVRRQVQNELREDSRRSTRRHAPTKNFHATLETGSSDSSKFLKFLQNNGGHSGGWSESDHLKFLKLKAKYSDERLIEKLLPQLPSMQRDDIERHIDWYGTYVQLKNDQRKCVEMWKSKRLLKKMVISKLFEAEPKRQVKKRIVRDEHEEKEKLRKWKEEQERKKREKEEELIEKKRLKKLEEVKRKQECEEKKMMLIKWKEEQKKQQRKVKREDTPKPNKRFNMKMLKQFQSQDLKYVKKKKEILERRTNDKEKIEMGSVFIGNGDEPRHPERVYRATKEWIEKTKPDLEKKTEKLGLIIFDLPKLGTPTWRRG